MTTEKVIIIGGKGRLATELRRCFQVQVISLSHADLDVRDRDKCVRTLLRLAGSEVTVINCAAILTLASGTNPDLAWSINGAGALNVSYAAAFVGARVVYISTDYVFSGSDCPANGYQEYDRRPRRPVNEYGYSKIEGEDGTLAYERSLVLRAPFRYGPPWIYDNAFTDQFTSAQWISEAAACIAQAALSDLTGILHIGGKRQSLYDLATSVPSVRSIRPSLRAEWTGLALPRDTSLNCERWNNWLKSKYANGGVVESTEPYIVGESGRRSA